MSDREAQRRYQARYDRSLKGKAAKARHRQSDKGKASQRRGVSKWIKANRHKNRAHQAVYRAIKRGDLMRPILCEHCGREGFCEASHTDYDQPLDVEWLCRSCHRKKDGL